MNGIAQYTVALSEISAFNRPYITWSSQAGFVVIAMTLTHFKGLQKKFARSVNWPENLLIILYANPCFHFPFLHYRNVRSGTRLHSS